MASYRNEKDKQRRQIYQSDYHSKHREETNQKSREYYATHKEERKIYDQNYVRGHREERKLYNQKIRKEVKDFLIQKYGKICIVCGEEPKGSYLIFHEKNFKSHEHLTPNQVKTLWQNFVPLCRNCHRTLHRFKRFLEKFKQLLDF